MKYIHLDKKGFTLVETLIFIAMSTVLIAVSASSLKSILDYQQGIIDKGNLYENSGRFFSNFSLDARNSNGFQILDSGHRVLILGSPNIEYFREGNRIQKKVGSDSAYFITDTNVEVNNLNFGVYAGVVKVEVDFNSGEYTPEGYYWSRN